MSVRDSLDYGFGIVADADTRLLILGSLPGRQSLATRRYYAHPGNQFWRLLAPVVQRDLVALGYADRLAALRAAGIGLWDVAAAARREGSLDSALRDVEERNLVAAVAGLPALRALAFNGAAAYRIGLRQLGRGSAIALVALPSSSGAHAVGIATKQPAWAELANYI